MSTIILTGGGTAGHCIPHIALLPFLKKDFSNIIYIGSEKGIERRIIQNENIEYHYVTCPKLNRSFSLKNLFIPFSLIKGITQAKKLLKNIKPDVIFSKGGYVSLPVVIAGKKLNIPVILHESDLTLGLANKIASKFSTKVLTSFPETAKEVKNGEFTGAPIRREVLINNRENALSFFNFSGHKPVLLVTGGSQGAVAINSAVRNTLDKLLMVFDVIHVCGKNNLDNTIKKNGYYQTEYLNKMELAFSISSVCVSRAGSNTLFELIAVKLPSVLIPLPKDNSRGDQILNAEYFNKKGLFKILPQEQLTSKSLFEYITSTYNNRNNFIKKFNEYSFIDGNRKITRIIADSIR